MEIACGLYRANRTKQAEAFEAALGSTCNVLLFDLESALLAGRIEAELENVGSPVDAPDVIIAAIAMTARLPVVTGNTAHFHAIRRARYALTIEN
jgi:predicted nucleic acid-binding protein